MSKGLLILSHDTVEHNARADTFWALVEQAATLHKWIYEMDVYERTGSCGSCEDCLKIYGPPPEDPGYSVHELWYQFQQLFVNAEPEQV